MTCRKITNYRRWTAPSAAWTAANAFRVHIGRNKRWNSSRNSWATDGCWRNTESLRAKLATKLRPSLLDGEFLEWKILESRKYIQGCASARNRHRDHPVRRRTSKGAWVKTRDRLCHRRHSSQNIRTEWLYSCEEGELRKSLWRRALQRKTGVALLLFYGQGARLTLCPCKLFSIKQILFIPDFNGSFNSKINKSKISFIESQNFRRNKVHKLALYTVRVTHQVILWTFIRKFESVFRKLFRPKGD